jgi:hypothetical protein
MNTPETFTKIRALKFGRACGPPARLMARVPRRAITSLQNLPIEKSFKKTNFIVNAIAGLAGRTQSSKKKYLSQLPNKPLY